LHARWLHAMALLPQKGEVIVKGIPNVPWESQKKSDPPPELKPAHNHKLKHNPFNGRWSCECGYVLGDGREKLLAPCPLTLKKKPKGKTLVEVFAAEDRKEKHANTRKRKSKDAKNSARRSR